MRKPRLDFTQAEMDRGYDAIRNMRLETVNGLAQALGITYSRAYHMLRYLEQAGRVRTSQPGGHGTRMRIEHAAPAPSPTPPTYATEPVLDLSGRPYLAAAAALRVAANEVRKANPPPAPEIPDDTPAEPARGVLSGLAEARRRLGRLEAEIAQIAALLG